MLVETFNTLFFLLFKQTNFASASDATPIQASVFNPTRFNRNITDTDSEPADFSPSTLNLTEAILNEYLINVTISSIAIGTWREMTPVNITEFQNTYSFSQPYSLILPYSICLLLGLLCNLLGFWSLTTNGESAQDDGFLQIMTTTRGDTEMDRIARRYKVGGDKDAEMKLLNLKVRYGEMVDEDAPEEERGGKGQKRWGFGNVEETVELRRRPQKAFRSLNID
jgi:hypothetical protein